jgi:hypothetical protein
MGASSSWKTAPLFGNNVWIMGCTWLPNLSTYSLAVIRPWRVIMGPAEYCTTYCCPNHHRTSPWLTAVTRHSGLQASFGVLQTYTLPDSERNLKDDSSDRITRTFQVIWYSGIMVVTP